MSTVVSNMRKRSLVDFSVFFFFLVFVCCCCCFFFFFFSNFSDFGIEGKLKFFSLPMENFTAEICPVWKILVKRW